MKCILAVVVTALLIGLVYSHVIPADFIAESKQTSDTLIFAHVVSRKFNKLMNKCIRNNSNIFRFIDTVIELGKMECN